MNRSKLNFGASFEEIISIIPAGLSQSLNYGMNSASNSNYNLKGDDGKNDEAKSEARTTTNLASEQAFLSAIYNTIAFISFLIIIAIFGLLLSKKPCIILITYYCLECLKLGFIVELSFNEKS